MKISTIAGLASGLFAASVVAANAVAVAPASLSMSVVGAECDSTLAPIGPGGVLACGAAPDANGIDRTDSSNVNLGAADGQFFSLGLSDDPARQGYGGGILLEISPAFTGPAMVFEVTNPSNHWEAAEVFVSADSNTFHSMGIVTNGKGGSEAAINTVAIAGVWKYIAIVDYSLGYYGASGSEDGFDLDAITVSAVPVPAGVLLLGTALAGLGVARRKA